MKLCTTCVLPDCYPGLELDENGVCNFCRDGVEEQKEMNQSSKVSQFADEAELIRYLEKHRNPDRKYDVLVPISGGVDSCNALITIVEKYKLRPLAFHNDHCYEDAGATENVKKLCQKLDVDLAIMQIDTGFMKKLWKYTNEAQIPGLYSCYVCGNILYLNALELAHRYEIPMVINGYSKGQIIMVNNQEEGLSMLDQLVISFKERKDELFLKKFLDKYKYLTHRIAYQGKEDLAEVITPGKILVLPFYIFDFYQTNKVELRKQVEEYIDWQQIQTSYPKRTTNCTMVLLNTYVDVQKYGHSSYDFEYAELVRRGEMTREQALEDLKRDWDLEQIERLAREIDLDLAQFEDLDLSANQEETRAAHNQKLLMENEFDF